MHPSVLRRGFAAQVLEICASRKGAKIRKGKPSRYQTAPSLNREADESHFLP